MKTPTRESWVVTSATRMLVVVLLALCLPLLFAPAVHAQRGPHVLRLEGAGALAFRNDDERDVLGGGFGVGYEYRLLPVLGITAHVDGFYFPYDDGEFQGDGVATYHGFGAGLRLHVLPPSSRVDLWIEPAGKFVLTGDLKRGGADVGVGADFLVGDAGLAVGPFVRYAHVFQADDHALGEADGRFLQVGAALSWGAVQSQPEIPPQVEPVPQPEPGPAPAPPPPADADADGVPDAQDGCPDEPEDLDGDSDGDGCPDVDQDADGVPDGEDACPTEMGSPEANGCPAPAAPEPPVQPPPEPPAMRTIEVPQQVKFASGKATIDGRGVAGLRRVLRTLKSEPGIRRVRVVGHSDNRGDRDQNRELSRKRAQGVVDWLVGKGIESGRLEVSGRGSSEPIDAAETPAARAKNRRVEFEIVDPAGGQLPVSQP